MTGEQQVVFWRRALRIARTEIAALSALLIIALGVMTFVEVADDMTEADGQMFDQAVETLNASFPSGHALLSTVFYLTLGVMLTRAFPRKRLKAFVLGSAILIALLIGLTRVYLGAHWASDVIAGWCAGAAWAMALWLVAYAIERRQVVHHSVLQDDEPG